MRIIAGRLGGRTLVAPHGRGTRPTSDRVREALFSILGDLSGAEVLDLYAGTGALGLEAISRGAARATFVERARPALVALRANIDKLGVSSQCEVLATPVERALSTMAWGSEAFDLVLIDPPYADVSGGVFARELAKAVEIGLVASTRMQGNVVLEHASADDAPQVTGLECTDTRIYGDTSLSFYVR